jgi:hypothetical protein
LSLVVTSIDVRGNVTDDVAATLEKYSPNRVVQTIAEPMRIFWRDRMLSLGTNKRGWPSTGFWEDAARQTVAIVQGDSLLLRCTKQGVRQRALGGPIRPVRAGALAIPISAVSYGRSPKEFPGLFLLRTAKGAWLVQAGESLTATGKSVKGTKLGGNSKRRIRAGLNFLFKLSKGVNQKPDERVIPTADEFTEVALGAIRKELA